MPAECRGREGKVAVQKASLLGKAYAAVCNIYCFVKTWKSKPVSPFLFFWTVVGAFDPMGVNKQISNHE